MDPSRRGHLLATRLRVPVEGLGVGLIELPEEEGRYVVKVHRKAAHDELLLFDPAEGLEADGVIEDDRLPTVRVRVVEVRHALVRNMPVTVLQAVGKADKPEQAVRDATALGATRVEFLTTSRTIVRGTKESRTERLSRVAAQVARQCGRGDLPTIAEVRGLEEALGELPAPSAEDVRLVCGLSEGAVPLLGALRDTRFPEVSVRVLIGPEGGFTSSEMDLAKSAGFAAITLGPYVLRMETACAAVLGALRALATERS